MATENVSRLQDFVAHSDKVNCIAIGRNAGRYLATGGEDRKVNIWHIGKPNAVATLAGHTSPVECVRFDNTDEVVVAGSSSGTLKLWDVKQGKAVRTLTGHKSNIRCLDFHPYGDFIASGSQDTNLKIWDIRRKGCIQTYKGHTEAINVLSFSPDGHWVVSGGEDGVVKLWDLTAGKLMTEFRDHAGPVTDLQFHPSEFLLATGSADRTVKFWDLESFQCVSTSRPESSRVRRICFDPLGRALYSGSKDSFKVYGWEPEVTYDSLSMGWGRLQDMHVKDPEGTTLVAASCHNESVSVWLVDLQNINFDRNNAKPDAREPRSAAAARAPSKAETPRAANASAETQVVNRNSTMTSDADSAQRPRALPRAPAATANAARPRISSSSSTTASSGAAQLNVPAPKTEPNGTQALKRSWNKTDRPVIPSTRDKPLDLDVSEFLPSPIQDVKRNASQTEDELLASLRSGHTSMMTIMSTRARNIQIVKKIWAQGRHRQALEQMVDLEDNAALVDLLNLMLANPNVWTLDCAVAVLPAFANLINSKHETYVIAACQTTNFLLKSFGTMIHAAGMTAAAGRSVDVSKEERHEKCCACYESLQVVKEALQARSDESGKLGSAIRKAMRAIEVM